MTNSCWAEHLAFTQLLPRPETYDGLAGLRNDAFETKGAGALQHQLAVLDEVRAVADSAAAPFRSAGSRSSFAADERLLAQIASVEIETIEGVIDEAVERVRR